jgi:hypothetical protein
VWYTTSKGDNLLPWGTRATRRVGSCTAQLYVRAFSVYHAGESKTLRNANQTPRHRQTLLVLRTDRPGSSRARAGAGADVRRATPALSAARTASQPHRYPTGRGAMVLLPPPRPRPRRHTADARAWSLSFPLVLRYVHICHPDGLPPPLAVAHISARHRHLVSDTRAARYL